MLRELPVGASVSNLSKSVPKLRIDFNVILPSRQTSSKHINAAKNTSIDIYIYIIARFKKSGQIAAHDLVHVEHQGKRIQNLSSIIRAKEAFPACACFKGLADWQIALL